MQILFLTRRFWPQIGGVETHALEIGKRLVELGHEVVVVAETFSPISKQIPKGINVYRIPVGEDNWFKKFRIWSWFWRNRKLIEEADLVHAHDVGFWYWPFRLFYPSKPFFITFHGWEGKFPLPPKNKIVRKISERIARGSICVGDYIKKWYGTKTDFVTYGGTDSKLKIKSEKLKVAVKSLKLIAFIGRLEKDTGLLIYFRALELLNKKYSILFLGDGRLRKEAEKYGKVLGFVKNIRPHILKSRFVFTSGYLSILEAMACRKLIFAVYDNPLKEDYLKMSPFAEWIIMERNPKDFVDKLMYYFEHPEEEKELVDKAYEWAKIQSWEKVVRLYIQLWGS